MSKILDDTAMAFHNALLSMNDRYEELSLVEQDNIDEIFVPTVQKWTQDIKAFMDKHLPQ